MESALQISDTNSYHYSSNENSVQVIPEFSVRIVVCDYYLTRPIPGIDVICSEFRGSNIKQVPVLRVFGSTPEGRKACLHIHGVFPYFYIPCPTSNPEPQYLYQIAASLDKALNIALKQATSSNQHVYKISLVKGLPFYGFHDKDHLYLKIFLYNPGLIKQAVDLCSNGAILGQSLQPHESHLNFTLQFFIDFNLFGMSNIDLQKVKHRRSELSQKSDEPLNSPDELNLKPESICYYEADCVASHIINRQRVGKGDGIENPGLEEVWNQEMERRKQLNVSMASKSLSQDRINSEETTSHHRFEEIFLMKMTNVLEKPVKIEVENTKNFKNVHYPAETKDGSELLNATDVSTHLPDNMAYSSFNRTLNMIDDPSLKDIDNTMVNEDIALNSSLSLHYSQVALDSEDLELVDMLQDLDEKQVEEGSIMGTPVNADEEDIESDDAEYSQIFDEETNCLQQGFGQNNSLSWNDSFWDGVNIPQLDGTSDEEHLKKVKKRKMRSLKLGLSKPKNKKKNKEFSGTGIKIESEKSNMPDNDLHAKERKNHDGNVSPNNYKEAKLVIVKDNKNVTVKDVNAIRQNNQQENQNMIDVKDDFNDSVNIIDTSINDEEEDTKVVVSSGYSKNHTDSSTVWRCKTNRNPESLIEKAATSYDLQNQYKPIPGPSTKNITEVNKTSYPFLSYSFDSSPEDENLGIQSFYDTSKLFDCSMEESEVINNPLINSKPPSNLTLESDNEINGKVNKSPERLSQSWHSEQEVGIVAKKTIEFNENTMILVPKIRAPTANYVISTLDKYLIPHNKTQEPYFSNHKDVGDKIELGQIILKLNSRLAKDQKPFEKVLNTVSIEERRQLLFMQTHEALEGSTKPSELIQLLADNKEYILQPLRAAPTTKEILRYLEQKRETDAVCPDKTDLNIKNIDDIDSSQAIGLNDDEINNTLSLESSDKVASNLDSTLQVSMQPDGSFLCFGNSASQKECSNNANAVELDFLTLMLVEVHTSVRGDLHPDPSFDAIQAVFITIRNNCPPSHFLTRNLTLALVVDDKNNTHKILDRCTFNCHVTYYSNETKILEQLIKLVQEHDPDIMCGYEIEMSSWGYVIERAQILGLEIVKEISRITEKHRQKKWRTDDNEIEGKVIGRITFNVWQLFRHELALSSYSFENCMFEILKERVPLYTYRKLSQWWDSDAQMMRWITVEYYLTILSGTLRMLEKLDIINRTSELARLFGLQWWEVLSRGSQFRVESLMLRAARPLNLVALSPTVKQRAAMRAPECLPLILEPESRFYKDPVIVLDFQSLYPSMMIAYNYCFSTCIGRVQNICGDSQYEFGAWRLRVGRARLRALAARGLVHWSPAGAGFVRARVRRGVLPALLRRILAARRAVKIGAKMQTDEAVRKAMHSRQLGLKLIANVTYGYTAANFSGRMPCVEVGDSVVAKGRETLERAIALVRGNPRWNVKVVYGDTDSMFVLVPGASRADAFRVGQEIADAVTADNPSPVALKLEKVYQPCILQTKKRYVGYMYESADQQEPVYEAKGIETVRRDGCPAGVKLLQQSLCELFSSGDVSRVKRLVTSQLARLAEGALPPPELMFTREYRGPAGYRPGAAAPPLEIAKRVCARDRRAVPRAGWRVRWAVAAGAPGVPLCRLARAPRELLADPSIAPHVGYYAARALLPPLHRCLSLLGVDVYKWWREVGWKGAEAAGAGAGGGGGIARYMQRGRCATCAARGARSVCAACAARPAVVSAALAARAARATTHLQYCNEVCASCCGHAQSAACENTECPVRWRRAAALRHLDQVRDVLANLPPHFNRETFQF